MVASCFQKLWGRQDSAHIPFAIVLLAKGSQEAQPRWQVESPHLLGEAAITWQRAWRGVSSHHCGSHQSVPTISSQAGSNMVAALL